MDLESQFKEWTALPRSWVVPALECGAGAGAIGGIYWGARQILIGRIGFVGLGLAGAIEAGFAGTVFSFARQAAMHGLQVRKIAYASDGGSDGDAEGAENAVAPAGATEREYILASTVAGAAAAGLTVCWTRGRKRTVPGAVKGAIAAAIGQTVVNWYTRPAPPREPFLKRLAKAKWSPVQYLTHEEHRELLREKLLHIEVEISIIDDKIVALRKEAAEAAATTSQPGKEAESK